MRLSRLFGFNQGVEPLSNTYDQDETGMDDLMRMACGEYQEIETNSPSYRNAANGSYDHSMEEQVFCQTQGVPPHFPQETISSIPAPTYYSRNVKLFNHEFTFYYPVLRFPHRGCIFCLRLLACILISLVYIGLNVGLGYYGIFVYETDKLVIDKSVKSFSIPNHQAYINYESFMLAKKNVTIKRRRSVDTFPPVNNIDDLDAFKFRKPIYSKNPENFELPSLFSFPESQMKEVDVFSFHRLTRWLKRSVSEIDCAYEHQSRARWKMHVIYLAHGDEDKNMFTKERLQTAHEIERKIMEHPDFVNFCLRDPDLEKYIPAIQNMQGCVPPNSLLTYFFPSQDIQGNVYYDNMGTTIGDIDSALKLAMNHESFYYYVDDKINKTYQKSQLLRTEVLFGAPLQGFSCFGEKSRKDQDDKFRSFIVTYINMLSKASTDKVHVLYGGNEIFDYEVTTTFWNDVRLAIISLIAIFILMLVLSLSPFLTVIGMVIIGVSFPISLFFYRVVFRINALGILNGAAAFVIIGIGVDDVFVFINIFRQASHLQNLVKRLKYTVRIAGVATFFTSFTTAAAFAANLTSSIPAVHDFGLFMSLVVSACWISVFILMPPALYMYSCIFEPLENFIFGCFCCCFKRKTEATIANVDSEPQVLACENRIYEDDDVPMLNIEEDNQEQNGCTCEDEMLLMDDPYASPDGRLHLMTDSDSGTLDQEQSQPSQEEKVDNTENMYLGKLIHKFLMFLTDRLVIPGRFVIIGVCVILLVTSCVLMSRLRPSTHPPQLFRPNTNIQQLLDLKANFSFIDAIQCDHCSGLYNLNPSNDLNAIFQTTRPPVTNKHTSGESNLDVVTKLSAALSDISQRSQNLLVKMLAETLLKFIDIFSAPDQPQATSQPSSLLPYSTSRVLMRTTPFLPSVRLTTAAPKPKTTERNPPISPVRHTTENAGQQILPVQENFDACSQQKCNSIKDRPLLESGATVYVVFGVKGVDRSNEDVGHVLDQYKTNAKFDQEFSKAFDPSSLSVKDHLKELCLVCKFLANFTDLVKPGSARCIPSIFNLVLKKIDIPECQNLPDSISSYSSRAQAQAEGGFNVKTNQIVWLAFAFESTTSEGQAYFEAYKQYEKWEELLSHIKSNILSHDSPLHSMFQTSKFWTKVLMEVVAVSSAIYGLVLSMIICIISVAIFTGHLVLLVIIVAAIIVMICCVVGIFFLAGWEMGAVEAVSLSILVGSSVDYCVHIVEGYILSGHQLSNNKPASVIRRERASQAVRHIGVAIVCSALTTIIAAVPLTQTFIQPFSKFGSILLINTTVSLVMTLTFVVALLAAIGPAYYKGTWRSYIKATVVVVVLTGAFILSLYIATVAGVSIPGPSGSPLFS